MNKQLSYFLELMALLNESTSSMLQMSFHSKLRNRFFKFVKVSRVTVESFDQVDKADQATYHRNYIESKRSSKYFSQMMTQSPFKVENLSLAQELKWNPFFFVEIYEKSSLASEIGSNLHGNSLIHKFNLQKDDPLRKLYITKLLRQRKSHLVILCHGYGGKKTDMRVLENYLVKIFPHTIFLVSEFNHNMQEKSIQELGRNLAHEVETFVSKFTKYSKISFVGHSLGGVIIRAAMPFLKKLRPYMCSYVSISVPHLGCRNNKNLLVNLGMNLLVSVKKDTIIKQLQMNEHPDPKKTFLYKLSHNDCLHWFENILLVSTPQDSFVPYFSARIQPPEDGNDEFGQITKQMAQMIWSKVSNKEIIRFDVDINSLNK